MLSKSVKRFSDWSGCPATIPWRFEWRTGKVMRITKAFVFVIYPDDTVQRHKPTTLRHPPVV